ncbi:hypothetical protein NSB1T_08690 [Coprobacter fastidiosus NSB1 = JCM 33896]|nr:hypothetical protein NSB1T_08690 [Coprobacter fastidiosus NSB1 = JCM 33896]
MKYVFNYKIITFAKYCCAGLVLESKGFGK